MKFAITLCILSLVLMSYGGYGQDQQQSQDFLNVAEMARIRMNQTLWTPNIPDRFVGATMKDLKALVSVLPPRDIVKGGLRGSDDSGLYAVYSDEGIFAGEREPQTQPAMEEAAAQSQEEQQTE